MVCVFFRKATEQEEDGKKTLETYSGSSPITLKLSNTQLYIIITSRGISVGWLKKEKV